MNLFRKVLLFHLVAAALAFSANARALACIDPFSSPAEKPLHLTEGGVLSEHEQRRADEILASGAPGNERWTEVANMYLDARLRLFPIEERDSIRRVLTKFRPQFAGISEWEASTKGMIYPRAYAETPLPYVIMVHEWEHMIRSYARSGGRDFNAGSMHAKFNPAAMYIEEAGAIRAEWELARFISPTEAVHLIRITRELTANVKINSVVETIVTSRDLDRQDYLKATRASGRYSIGNVVQKTTINTAIAGGVVGYIGAVGGGLCALVTWLAH
jgi:hypothetical protein